LIKKKQKIKAELKWLKIFFVSLKENKLIATSSLFRQIFFLNASQQKFFNSHFNYATFLPNTDLKEI
jgi:hypothetical protein